MRPTVNPKTGLLEWPEPPMINESQRHRAWWSIRLSLTVGVLSIVTLTTSLVSLSKPYDQLRLASILFGLVLSVVVVGVAVWVIAHEPKRAR